MMSFASRFVS